jgi:rhodanese-related sulfurtransferase
MKKVTVQQFNNEIKADPSAQCVDVREPSEHAQARLENFNLCSLSGLSEHSVSALDKTKRTYLLCRTCNRACQAGERLEKMGFTDLRVIEGGLNAMQEAGAAVIQGRI